LTEEKEEEQVKVVQVREVKEAEKLLIRSLSVSPTGRLTINFSKPIFAPPFKRVEKESSEEAPQSSETSESSESSEKFEDGLRYLQK